MTEIDRDDMISWDEDFERECGYLPDGSPLAARREADKRSLAVLLAQAQASQNMAHSLYTQQALAAQHQNAMYGSAMGQLGNVLAGTIR